MKIAIKLSSTITRCAMGAAILIAFPMTASASSDGQDIIVRSSQALEHWRAEMTRDLNQALSRSGVSLRSLWTQGVPNNAIVQVRFSLDENGNADKIVIYNNEGNRAAAKIAIRAIRQLTNLDKVPVSNPRDAQFLANIVFYNSDEDRASLSARLMEMESERLASRGEESKYLALGY